jgi:hypothetical protein
MYKKVRRCSLSLLEEACRDTRNLRGTVRQVDTQAYWSLAHFTRGHVLRIEYMEEIILIIAQSLGLMLLSLRPDRCTLGRTSACELCARGCTRAKTAPIAAISISFGRNSTVSSGLDSFWAQDCGPIEDDDTRVVSREPSYMVRCPEHITPLWESEWRWR